MLYVQALECNKYTSLVSFGMDFSSFCISERFCSFRMFLEAQIAGAWSKG
jgi:hypothetical protein